MMMYEKLMQELAPFQASLIAVSKTKPAGEILRLYKQGQRIFGENRVQELVEKQSMLPVDIQWHMIGRLQRNKVKYIAPFVSLIQSVDSVKLLKEINQQAIKCNRVIPVLLEFHIAKESSKTGFSLSELAELLTSESFTNFANIEIQGVMGMATFTDDEVQIRSEFRFLTSIFHELKLKYFADSPNFKTISMGMSGDYPIALQEGANMVRIGSLLFGARS